MSDFAIRPMVESDEPFVFSAWLSGYWPHFPGNVIVSKSEFLQRYHRVIERILSDPKTRTVVAYLPEKPDALLGFACGGPRCLHWCYVKQAFRKLGIAHALDDMLGNPCEITHWIPDNHWQKYAPHLLKDYGD